MNCTVYLYYFWTSTQYFFWGDSMVMVLASFSRSNVDYSMVVTVKTYCRNITCWRLLNILLFSLGWFVQM